MESRVLVKGLMSHPVLKMDVQVNQALELAFVDEVFNKSSKEFLIYLFIPDKVWVCFPKNIMGGNRKTIYTKEGINLHTLKIRFYFLFRFWKIVNVLLMWFLPRVVRGFQSLLKGMFTFVEELLVNSEGFYFFLLKWNTSAFLVFQQNRY